ncbi:hypothetical protein D7Y28_18220 [Stenotrophomonas maltophilia]|nr:hypothetical protein [Stenotrophomonas maltophilia]
MRLSPLSATASHVASFPPPALLSVRSQLVQVRLKFIRRQANLLLAFWRLVADQMHETLNQAMALNLTLILVLLSGFRVGAAE